MVNSLQSFTDCFKILSHCRYKKQNGVLWALEWAWETKKNAKLFGRTDGQTDGQRTISFYEPVAQTYRNLWLKFGYDWIICFGSRFGGGRWWTNCRMDGRTKSPSLCCSYQIYGWATCVPNLVNIDGKLWVLEWDKQTKKKANFFGWTDWQTDGQRTITF